MDTSEASGAEGEDAPSEATLEKKAKTKKNPKRIVRKSGIKQETTKASPQKPAGTQKLSRGSQAKSKPDSVENNNKDLAKFPRHAVDKALRIPRALIDQNAGKETTDRESANFAGVGFNGPYRVEISSAIKYGFLERLKQGHISVTERARQALRPQNPGDEISALRAAVLSAPDISQVYKHYRGENLPERKFLDNTLIDNYNIPPSKAAEFVEVFIASLKAANLIEQVGDKQRVIDATVGAGSNNSLQKSSRHSSKTIKIDASADSCFVVMPFSSPVGGYYQTIYEPAIKKAGLRPIRADADIFGTGKIIDQIWFGINSAKVLIAELTGRNANVFYELGLAHALNKPVVLVSSNGDDVPFDLKHIRVIYYDVNDPF